MLFKDKLFELRQSAGLTQKAVADKAGMSMLTYRNYEQGTRLPGLPAFMKIVMALGVPCEVFAACEDLGISDGPPAREDSPGRPRGRPPKSPPAPPPADDLQAERQAHAAKTARRSPEYPKAARPRGRQRKGK